MALRSALGDNADSPAVLLTLAANGQQQSSDFSGSSRRMLKSIRSADISDGSALEVAPTTGRRLQQGNGNGNGGNSGNGGPPDREQNRLYDIQYNNAVERYTRQGFSPAEAEALAQQDTCERFPNAQQCQSTPVSPSP